mmetsp:Transcript_29575/g.86282  ORF Transcript_29575/g.86282 Transcript_29575/m.86282 type:complete len:270 (+) Transcript_29575:392-1201(+)
MASPWACAMPCSRLERRSSWPRPHQTPTRPSTGSKSMPWLMLRAVVLACRISSRHGSSSGWLGTSRRSRTRQRRRGGTCLDSARSGWRGPAPVWSRASVPSVPATACSSSRRSLRRTVSSVSRLSRSSGPRGPWRSCVPWMTRPGTSSKNLSRATRMRRSASGLMARTTCPSGTFAGRGSRPRSSSRRRTRTSPPSGWGESKLTSLRPTFGMCSTVTARSAQSGSSLTSTVLSSSTRLATVPSSPRRSCTAPSPSRASSSTWTGRSLHR